MTDEYKSLAKALRSHPTFNGNNLAAADLIETLCARTDRLNALIETLTAENERLRAALENIALPTSGDHHCTCWKLALTALEPKP